MFKSDKNTAGDIAFMRSGKRPNIQRVLREDSKHIVPSTREIVGWSRMWGYRPKPNNRVVTIREEFKKCIGASVVPLAGSV